MPQTQQFHRPLFDKALPSVRIWGEAYATTDTGCNRGELRRHRHHTPMRRSTRSHSSIAHRTDSNLSRKEGDFEVHHPLVSILIPAYNAQPWITTTIACALGQSWPNTEIIVVDDGSRDGTLEMARRCQGPKVKVISQENQGASVARNRALAEAQGEFIQYLDADDLISANKLEVQVSRLAAAPGHIATCQWGRFVNEVETARFVEDPIWTDLGPVEWLVQAWSTQCMMAVHAWLTPREVAEAAGAWSPARCPVDDAEYFTRVVLASSGVVFSPEAQAFYRSGITTSLSQNTSHGMRTAILDALERCTRYLLRAEDSPRTRKASAALLQQFIYTTYPDALDLVGRAERLVDKFGGSDLPFKAGGRLGRLQRMVGWKNAKCIQCVERQLRAAVGKR